MERGTQQENSYTKHAVTNRLSVTATLGRVKESPTLEFVDDKCWVKHFFRRISRRQLLRIKTNRLGFKDHKVATKCYS